MSPARQDAARASRRASRSAARRRTARRYCSGSAAGSVTIDARHTSSTCSGVMRSRSSAVTSGRPWVLSVTAPPPSVRVAHSVSPATVTGRNPRRARGGPAPPEPPVDAPSSRTPNHLQIAAGQRVVAASAAGVAFQMGRPGGRSRDGGLMRQGRPTGRGRLQRRTGGVAWPLILSRRCTRDTLAALSICQLVRQLQWRVTEWRLVRHQLSRRTWPAGTSSRSPRQAGWRNRPSRVISA